MESSIRIVSNLEAQESQDALPGPLSLFLPLSLSLSLSSSSLSLSFYRLTCELKLIITSSRGLSSSLDGSVSLRSRHIRMLLKNPTMFFLLALALFLHRHFRLLSVCPGLIFFLYFHVLCLNCFVIERYGRELYTVQRWASNSKYWWSYGTLQF